MEIVDICKGIGIILVLLGHYGPAFWWNGAYTSFVRIIYEFHMPLFFFLSGYLYSYTESRNTDLWLFIKKKSRRLLLPYCTISIGYIILKTVGQPFFSYHPISFITLLDFFVLPDQGPASLLWFIYTLFLIFIIFAILRRLFVNDTFLLVVALAPMLLFSAPAWLSLNQIIMALPLFTIGYLFHRHSFYKNINPILAFVLSISIFMIITLLNEKRLVDYRQFIYLVESLSGTLMCWSASVLIDRYARTRQIRSILLSIGIYSPSIYLLHQPFVWLIPFLGHNKLGLSGALLLIGIPVALLLGIAAPVFLDKQILQKNKIAHMAVLGS